MSTKPAIFSSFVQSLPYRTSGTSKIKNNTKQKRSWSSRFCLPFCITRLQKPARGSSATLFLNRASLLSPFSRSDILVFISLPFAFAGHSKNAENKYKQKKHETRTVVPVQDFPPPSLFPIALSHFFQKLSTPAIGQDGLTFM